MDLLKRGALKVFAFVFEFDLDFFDFLPALVFDSRSLSYSVNSEKSSSLSSSPLGGESSLSSSPS